MSRFTDTLGVGTLARLLLVGRRSSPSPAAVRRSSGTTTRRPHPLRAALRPDDRLPDGLRLLGRRRFGVHARLDVARPTPTRLRASTKGSSTSSTIRGDNIQVIDPSTTSGRCGSSARGGIESHDIAVVAADRAYVSRNGMSSLLVVDPRNGSARGEISLAGFATATAIRHGSHLYQDPYSMSRSSESTSAGNIQAGPPSYLAVVDARADTLVDMDPAVEGVQGIVLQGLNPSARWSRIPRTRDLRPESGSMACWTEGSRGSILRPDARPASSRGNGSRGRPARLRDSGGRARVRDDQRRLARDRLVTFNRQTGAKIATSISRRASSWPISRSCVRATRRVRSGLRGAGAARLHARPAFPGRESRSRYRRGSAI